MLLFLLGESVLIGSSTELEHWSWAHLSSFVNVLIAGAKYLGAKLVLIMAT